MKDFVKIISQSIEKPLCILDIETNDISTETAETISFACIKIFPKEDDYIEFKFLCRPIGPINKFASEVHGYKIEDLEKEESFKFYSGKIIDLLEDSMLSGYNLINFDLKILDRQLSECGYKDFFKDKTVFDSFVQYKIHSSRKLGDALLYYTNEQLVDGHDALIDVLATGKVIAGQINKENVSLEKMVENLAKTSKKEEFSGFSKFILLEEGKEPKLNFSKHKGKNFSEIDSGFFTWALKQPFIPEDCKSFITKCLKEKNTKPKQNKVIIEKKPPCKTIIKEEAPSEEYSAFLDSDIPF